MHSRVYTLEELSELVGAQLRGDPHYSIDGLATLEDAQSSQMSFLANAAYQKHLSNTAAGAVILNPAVAETYTGNCLVVDDPYRAYARISGLFSRRPQSQPGIHPTATVAETAVVAPTAAVGPRCVIEQGAVVGDHTELAAGVVVGANTVVGAHCRLYPNVTLYHGVTLADHVTIHSATVIGSDGFGYAPTSEGAWEKIHQLGGVVIEDHVEIGAGCTIDRGALSNTHIGRGVIIDNQVHLAHNVKIGNYTAIAGCCGIAGSTEIGAYCLLGGSVNISGHLKIADHVRFNGASVVTKSIREAGVYSSGTPLQPAKQWQKSAVRFGQLDKLFARVKQLESGDNNVDQ